MQRIELEADPPFGTVRGTSTACSRCRLSPATGSCFFTDGMLERNTRDVDIHAMVATGAHLHPREAVQHLTQALLEATQRRLNDDATALCLDWHGGPHARRTSRSGADR